MTFAIIDWVFSIIILIFAISGVIKGFIDNVFGKIAFVAGILLGYLFYKDLAAVILKDIKYPYVANGLAFLLIFVVTFLAIKILQMIIAKAFEWSILKSLDRTLGFIFGIVEGLAVVCLLIFILSAQPFFSVENLFDGSFFYNLVTSLFNSTKEEIGNNV
ncbi:MAG: CvpA family protein [Treponema sp.]|nr:CvpA family protein [Treponema sp.]